MRRAAAACAAAVMLVATGCGASHSSTPTADPKQVAVKVLGQIVHNRYTQAWDSLHPSDQDVAPRVEYVSCETRSPVIAVPTSVKVRRRSQRVGRDRRRLVSSRAPQSTCGSASPAASTSSTPCTWSRRTASGRWILPPTRYRDYKADRCPTDAGSTPAADDVLASGASRLAPRRARARGAARPAGETRRPRRRAGTARSSVTPRARNQSQTRSTSFSGADAPRRDADDLDAVEPVLVDLGLVVDQVGRDAACARRPRRAGSSSTSCASRSRAAGRSRRASP